MEGTILTTCRLCLSVNTSCKQITQVQEEMIEIIVPDLNIHVCNELYICGSCTSALEAAFSFKSTCLDIEGSVFNYSNDGLNQVNLDNLLGLKELELNDRIEKNSKVCRTCLNITKPLCYIRLDKQDSPVEWELLHYSLPEVDLQLTIDPIICINCLPLLEKLYHFYKMCIDNDNRICTYLENKPDNFKINFNLIDLFESSSQTQNDVSNIVNEEIHIKEDVDCFSDVEENLRSLDTDDSNLKKHNALNSTTNDDDISKTKEATEYLGNTEIFNFDNTSPSEQDQRKKTEDPTILAIELLDSSDETDSNKENTQESYNPSNKRKTIVIEGDNEDSVEEDYIEGAEKIGWAPKKRPCTFCQNPISSTLITSHTTVCTKNPKNQFMTSCVDCGIRMTLAPEAQNHAVCCQTFPRWKLKSSNLEDIGNTRTEGLKRTAIGNMSNEVIDLDLEILQLPTSETASNTEGMLTENIVNGQLVSENQTDVTIIEFPLPTNNTFVFPHNEIVPDLRPSDDDSLKETPKSTQSTINVIQNIMLVEKSSRCSGALTDSTVSQMEVVERNCRKNFVPENSFASTNPNLCSSSSETDYSKRNGINSEDHLSNPDTEEDVISVPIVVEDDTEFVSSSDGDTAKSSEFSQEISVQTNVTNPSNSVEPRKSSILSDISTVDIMKSKLIEIASSFSENMNSRLETFMQEVNTQFLGVLKCDKCNYNTRRLHAIETHVLTHFSESKKNEVYGCSVCHKLVSGLYRYLKHMKDIHKCPFYRSFYWCVKCATVFEEMRMILFHKCTNEAVKLKMFRSNRKVFCLHCNFESDDLTEAKKHVKICLFRDNTLKHTDVIEIEDD